MGLKLVDRYFIKSFIATSVFLFVLVGGIVGLSFLFEKAALFFIILIAIFFVWYYKFIENVSRRLFSVFNRKKNMQIIFDSRVSQVQYADTSSLESSDKENAEMAGAEKS